MVPNLAPLFFIFVLMGALAIRLDSATVMIASVVLGITVDDTIHLFHGFRRRLKQGMSPVFAIARSYEATGRAVLATSAILVGQFMLLALSDFVPTANFGLMTAAGLAAGLAFELILLPALLVLGYGVARRTSQVGKTRSGKRRTVRDEADTTRPPRIQPTLPQAPDLIPARETGLRRAAPGMVLAAATAASITTTRHVLVCKGERCQAEGALAVWRRLRAEQGLLRASSSAVQLRMTRTSCLGPCRHGPVIQVYPEDLLYGPMVTVALDRVIEEHLRGGKPVMALTRERPLEPAGKG